MRPRLRFLDFSKSWAFGKIIDLASICYGKSQSEVESNSGNYPIFGSGGIIGKANIFLYNKPSVLIGRKGTIDKPFYIETPFWTVDTMFYTRINEYTNANFIFYLFNTIKWKKYSEQSGVPSLSGSTIENINVFYPEKPEQDKIATFLNLYYKKIELQKQKIDLLKLLLKQKINDSFSQKNDSPKIKLSNLINQISIRNKNNLDLPVLSVSNKNGFVPQNEQFEEEVASEDKSGYKIIKINQFAYNPARINVGSIARLKDKYNIGQISPMYVCFECCNKIYNDYFEYYLSSQTFKKEMTKRLEGSVRMCLSFDSLCNIKISLPDFNQQKIIATNLSLIKNKIDLEEQKLTFMKTYKQGLLQQMFV